MVRARPVGSGGDARTDGAVPGSFGQNGAAMIVLGCGSAARAHRPTQATRGHRVAVGQRDRSVAGSGNPEWWVSDRLDDQLVDVDETGGPVKDCRAA